MTGKFFLLPFAFRDDYAQNLYDLFDCSDWIFGAEIAGSSNRPFPLKILPLSSCLNPFLS